MKNSGKKTIPWVVLLISLFLLILFFTTSAYHFPDGVGYFSYMSSLWSDKNLDFSNDFTRLRMTLPPAITSTGYIANLWPAGTSVLLSPFYLFGLFFYTDDSCAPVLVAITNLGSMLSGLIALLFIYQALKFLGLGITDRIISTFAAFAGTPLLYYSFFIPNSPHAISAFMVALLFYTWISTFNTYAKLSRWIILGLISGLMTAVRTNDILFALVVVAEILYRAFKERKNLINYLKYISVFAVSVFAGFLPQILIWTFLYGSPLAAPQAFNMSAGNFALKDLVFSKFHGIFWWTPVFLIAVAGLIVPSKKNSLFFIPALITFILQLLTISLLTAWWGGYSFAIRYLTNSCVIAGMGSAALILALDKKKTARLIARILIVACSLWTLILSLSARFGILDLQKMELPLGKILNLQNILSVTKSFFAIPFKNEFEYPFFIFYCAGLIFIFFSIWLLKKIKSLRLLIPNCIILVWILVFSHRILISQANKPKTPYPEEFLNITITQADLNRIFLLFDLRERINYCIYIKKEEKITGFLDKVKSMKMDTPIAESWYKNLLSVPPLSDLAHFEIRNKKR